MDEERVYSEMNKEVKNKKKPKGGISLVGKCEHERILKRANKKIINVVGKQGELLKRYKDSDDFFDAVGLIRSNIYFQLGLSKF